MQCSKCGRDNPDNAMFCNGCGSPVSLPPVQQGMNADRASALKILAVIGGLIMLVAMASTLSGNKSSTTSPASVISQSRDAAPTPANATWHTIATFKGNGTKQTETFAVRSDEWRITWDTKPGKYGDMNFQIYVYGSDGSMKDIAANIIGKDTDSTIIRGRGDYYLHINTAQPYVITIDVKY
jgi:zinc-ribbon domain